METLKASTGRHVRLYSASVWLSAILLLVCAAYMIIWREINFVVAVLVFMGATVLASSFAVYAGMSKPMKDERMSRISTTAATYAWFTTILFIGLQLFLGYLYPDPVSFALDMGLTIFITIGTWMAFYLYLNYVKGDIE